MASLTFNLTIELSATPALAYNEIDLTEHHGNPLLFLSLNVA